MSITASAYLHRDGVLSITHHDCGSTQFATPVRYTPETGGLYGSDAAYCQQCEAQGSDTTALHYNLSLPRRYLS